MNKIIKRNLESILEEIKQELSSIIIEQLSININEHKELFNKIDELFSEKYDKILKKINSCKRPLNPYFIFWKEKRPNIAKEYPNLIPKDITKKLSELWKNLEESEKDIYRSKAKILKKEFNLMKEELSSDNLSKKKRGRPLGSKNKKKKPSKNKSILCIHSNIGDKIVDDELDFDLK